jgi:hypothetical protein
MRLLSACLAATFVAAAPSVARAEDQHGIRPVEEHELDRRLAFLEHRIATERTHAVGWWWGWTAFYALGMTVESVRGANAADPVDKADYWIGAIQAAGGVTALLIRPESNIRGLAPAAGPMGTDEKLARVRYAEGILAHNADETHPFGLWYSHLINVGLNGISFVILGAGFHDWKKASISAGIGVSVGEAQILTQPWEADYDIEAYRRQFGGMLTSPAEASRRASAFRWGLSPAPGGVTVGGSF